LRGGPFPLSLQFETSVITPEKKYVKKLDAIGHAGSAKSCTLVPFLAHLGAPARVQNSPSNRHTHVLDTISKLIVSRQSRHTGAV